MLTCLDLFSGIGGFTLGFEKSLIEPSQFVELDPFCQRVLQRHWPNVPLHNDVSSFKPDKSYDIICGGFPCQDISVAGKGLGLQGERSGLWFQYFRLIEEIRPKYVIIENVKALVRRGLRDILEMLAAIGYDAEWYNIPAASVGLLQARERIWIVAYPSQDRKQRLITSEDFGEARQRWPSRQADLQQIFDSPTQRGTNHPQPLICGVDNRPANWAHRIAACGNAVTPRIPEIIGEMIIRDYLESA